MEVFKALHILSMFAMVTLFSGGEFLYSWAVWRRDVRGLVWVGRTLDQQLHIPVLGLGLLAAGTVFGLLTALTGGFDLLEGWLIAAYVLVALFVVSSILIGVPLGRLVDKAVEAEAGQRPVEDVVRDMAASSAVLFFPVNAAIFAAIILDMVLKPVLTKELRCDHVWPFRSPGSSTSCSAWRSSSRPLRCWRPLGGRRCRTRRWSPPGISVPG